MEIYQEKYGSCEIIFGPMGSGKTSKLTHELAMFADVGGKIGMKVLYINYIGDNRSTENNTQYVTTHSSQSKGNSKKIDEIKVEKLSEVDVSQYHVIGIDEGQFFSDIVETVRKWVLELNKKVIISSLDGDINMKPFGQVSQLICICEPDSIHKLASRCINCLYNGNPNVKAGFTKLRNNTTGSDITNYINIGGMDEYIPLCMKCYKEYMI